MKQVYNKYRAEDHKVWNILFSRQYQLIQSVASKSYLNGVEQCNFKAERVPKFAEINEYLSKATGWSVYVVPGLVDNLPFFKLLSDKQFPATTWLRSMKELDYLEEPDMFHDIFGHVPLLGDRYFCRFLEGLSLIALQYISDPMAIEYIARIYWYTVEFGLIKEEGIVKIYGAGILSSTEECKYAIREVHRHKEFDIDAIMNTEYIKDSLQEQYFVISSYKELFESLETIKDALKHTKIVSTELVTM